MKIGDAQMKKQALIALNDALREEEKYVKIIVELGDVIGLLVNFLEFAESKIQEEFAKAISVIGGFESCKSILVGAGMIGPLIQVLDVGSDLGNEIAARALKKLTENSNNAWLVSAHGGVTALLNICSSGSSSGELISSADDDEEENGGGKTRAAGSGESFDASWARDRGEERAA